MPACLMWLHDLICKRHSTYDRLSGTEAIRKHVPHPVQLAPVDIPAGPQPPFHDWPPVRRILSEVPIAVSSHSQVAQPDTTADAH